MYFSYDPKSYYREHKYFVGNNNVSRRSQQKQTENSTSSSEAFETIV